MSALAAGDQVILVAATKIPQAALPMFGICQAATPGPPPTAVTIDWANGTQTAYAVVGADATAVLYKVTASQESSLLGTIVRTSIFGDAGSRVQGRVVQQYLLLDPSGTDVGEIIVIDAPIGFLTIFRAQAILA